MKHMQMAFAEAFGTMVLVLVGAGTAVIAGPVVGLLGVALAFGLAVTTMAYTVGPVSGCHLNPAVSLAMALRGKMPWAHFPVYVVAQVVGGILGAAALYAIVGAMPGFDVTANFASNGYGNASPLKFGMMAVGLAEIVATGIFITVILGTTRKNYPAAMGGLIVGLTLAIMILTIGLVSNASLNPARSMATAVFQGGVFMEQLWFFWVTPLLGGALAAGIDWVLQCKECAAEDCGCDMPKKTTKKK